MFILGSDQRGQLAGSRASAALAAVVIVLMTIAFGVSTALADDRPNIIFMLSDDQGWDGLSVAMHPDVENSKNEQFHTPWVERLAGQGMRFTAAYAPSPVCAPTRCSLQTGRSAAANRWTKAGPNVRAGTSYKLIPPAGIRDLPAEITTVGEALQAAGYATAHFGKWHLGGGGPGANGYDAHDGDVGNEQAAKFSDPNPVDIFGMAERTEVFMKKAQQAGKPFFVQLSWLALHQPQNALKSTLAKYANMGGRERAAQIAAITEDLDTGVGRVMRSVERLGLADNTYIIYMSDNGAGGGGRRRNASALRGGKGSVWEGGIRVPLIVKGPAVAANSWSHVPVVGHDFYPTFCEWAAVPASDMPEDLEGGSLTSLLKNGGEGTVARKHEEMVFHFPHYQSSDGPHTALRLGDWKLMYFDETGKSSLYNLATDLGEQDDVAARHPERVADLVARMNNYLSSVDAGLAIPNPGYDPDSGTISTPQRRRRRRVRN